MATKYQLLKEFFIAHYFQSVVYCEETLNKVL